LSRFLTVSKIPQPSSPAERAGRPIFLQPV